MLLNEKLITLNGISKQYGKQEVLKSVSLTINRGDCIDLRGYNGAGKSTLLRIICGLITASSGERIVHYPNIVLGYAPDTLPNLRMTSTEYLTHMGSISGMPKHILLDRIKELHEFFYLEQSHTLKIVDFSKGMRQKVNLMQAILKKPDLLVLDEPLSGLDQESLKHLLVALKKIKDEGTAIVAAVHASTLADVLEFNSYRIDKGNLIRYTNEKKMTKQFAYELQCKLSTKCFTALKAQFPDVIWLNDGELIRFTVMQKDYRPFILQLTHEDGEIIHLQRKDITL